MPSVSGSPTQAATSARTVLELESIEAAQFQNGDKAYIFNDPTLVAIPSDPETSGRHGYVANFQSAAARNGTTVLYMRNSNPAYGAPTGALGRWILCDCGPNAVTGEPGPPGPPGPPGTSLSIFSEQLEETEETDDATFSPLLSFTPPNTAPAGDYQIVASVSSVLISDLPDSVNSALFRVRINATEVPFTQFANSGTSEEFQSNFFHPQSGAVSFSAFLDPAAGDTVSIDWRLASAVGTLARVDPAAPGQSASITIVGAATP